MAMLKTISQGHKTKDGKFYTTKTGHSGSCAEIDNYLYYGSKKVRKSQAIEHYLSDGHDNPHRPLAFATTNTVRTESEYGWSKEFDNTRRIYGKDYGRTYYHYVLSADPRDHMSADDLCQLALEWVNKALPGVQAIVSVHNDNAGEIMHAHIVVNSVYPTTGKKIWRSNKQVEREADIAQDLCRKHGMSYLPYLRDAKNKSKASSKYRQTIQTVRKDPIEENIIKSGGQSWKAEIREAIDNCVTYSHTWSEFESNLDKLGITIRYTKRGITFAHYKSSGFTFKVRDVTLGANYTDKGIESRLAFGLDEIIQETGFMQEAINQALKAPKLKPQKKRSRYAPNQDKVPTLDISRLKPMPRARKLTPKTKTSLLLENQRLTLLEFAQGKGLDKTHSVKETMRALNQLSAVRRYHLSSPNLITEKLHQIEEQYIKAQTKSSALVEGINVAESMLQKQARYEYLTARIAMLDGVQNPWTDEERMSVSKLRQEHEELNAALTSYVKGADGWLNTNMVQNTSRGNKIKTIAQCYIAQADKLRADVTTLKNEVETLQDLQNNFTRKVIPPAQIISAPVFRDGRINKNKTIRSFDLVSDGGHVNENVIAQSIYNNKRGKAALSKRVKQKHEEAPMRLPVDTSLPSMKRHEQVKEDQEIVRMPGESFAAYISRAAHKAANNQNQATNHRQNTGYHHHKH